MARPQITFQAVTFRYEGAPEALFDGLHATFPVGWSGIVGGNGMGKSTLMKLATEQLKPTQGQIHTLGNALYCAQRTDTIPDQFAAFLDALDGRAFELRGRLGIQEEWLDRWDTLSHGERKRTQIAIALWRQPAVLAVDEPTNHLDVHARQMLSEALHTYRGIGLLVSHDRQLLDDLCAQCAFVESHQLTIRHGGYSQGSQQLKQEVEHQNSQAEKAQAEHQKLKRELQRRREAASKSAKRVSKRGLDRKDHDAKMKVDLARVSGKDASDARRVREMEGRLSQARARSQSLHYQPSQHLGIFVAGEYSKRDTLFRFGPMSLKLGRDSTLTVPELVMHPRDRIALTGANGLGKSTLLGHIIQHLNLEADRLAHLPQEIDLARTSDIMTQAKLLPKDQLGRMMEVVSRLGSHPRRLLDSAEPSPGEIRKLLLALQIAKGPHLIMMDEPTNHLDLPAVECLEAALDECPCGLLLVSHDQQFLKHLTQIQWHLSVDSKDNHHITLTTSRHTN